MKKLINGLVVWKMALLKVCLLMFVAGATTFQTSMAGVEWVALTPTQKILVGLGVFITIANSVIAFLDKTMSRVAQGREPLETGTTQFVRKENAT